MSVPVPTGLLVKDSGALGSVAFGNLNVGNVNPRGCYVATVHCSDDNFGKLFFLLGQRNATTEEDARDRVRKMGKERREGIAERRDKWPEMDPAHAHVAVVDITGHAHKDTLGLSNAKGNEAWIVGSCATTVRFSLVVEEAAREFPPEHGPVLLHFSVCYLAGPGAASTRALTKLTARYPHVEIVLHDTKITTAEGQYFITELLGSLLRGGKNTTVVAVNKASQLMKHRVMHLARGEMRVTAARPIKGAPSVRSAEVPTRQMKVCPSTCPSIAHRDPVEIGKLVDTFVATLPEMDEREVRRGGYGPARLRKLWAEFLRKHLGGVDPHSLAAWNAMRDACAAGHAERVAYNSRGGFGCFTVF